MSKTRKHLSIAMACGVALIIFLFDLDKPFDGAIAVLYIAVILLVAPFGHRAVLRAGVGVLLLTILAFIVGHVPNPSEGAISRATVSLVAIASATALSLRDRSTRTTLSEQARILELSHDTVIIRDRDDTILYWNDGAEELYGWPRAEALGRKCTDLLHCSYSAQEVDEALSSGGHWSGEVMRRRRDGTKLVLASRWLLRRDPDGRSVGVIESSADLTERRRMDAERQASEQRFRTIFDMAGFAAWESDWSETMQFAIDCVPAGEALGPWLTAHPDLVQKAIDRAAIRNANAAAVDLFDAGSKEELVGGNLCGRYLLEGLPAVAQILASLAAGADAAENEIRMQTLDGRVVDIVLRVTLLPDGERWSNVLVMAFDVTERNEARLRLAETMGELAHAARVSMLGQLAASIVHEVNQPLTAIINYGKSAKRWISRPEPDLGELTECLDRITASGTRAAEVIGRVRSLARKAAPQKEAFDLRYLIEDTAALLGREARAIEAVILLPSSPDLPLVFGDRVQVQQVLINLMMNAIQAMADTAERKRELQVSARPLSARMVYVTVEDCGTGFRNGEATKIFEPFFTTKQEGMGMGLSICRSIIEAQGGQINASNNEGHGATIAFTLPVEGGAEPAGRGIIS